MSTRYYVSSQCVSQSGPLSYYSVIMAVFPSVKCSTSSLILNFWPNPPLNSFFNTPLMIFIVVLAARPHCHSCSCWLWTCLLLFWTRVRLEYQFVISQLLNYLAISELFNLKWYQVVIGETCFLINNLVGDNVISICITSQQLIFFANLCNICIVSMHYNQFYVMPFFKFILCVSDNITFIPWP